MAINGEAIYNTKPWTSQNDTLADTVWYTQSNNGNQIYAMILRWPPNNVLYLGAVLLPDNAQILLLGSKEPLKVCIYL